MSDRKKPDGRDFLVSILNCIDTLQNASDELLNRNLKALTAADDSLDYILAQFVEESNSEESE